MYFLEESEFGLVPEGQLVEGQAEEGHAQGPDVHCLPAEGFYIGVAALRSHKVIGTFCLGEDVVFSFFEELADTEVTEFGDLALGNQNILRLDISMYDVQCVHIV